MDQIIIAVITALGGGLITGALTFLGIVVKERHEDRRTDRKIEASCNTEIEEMKTLINKLTSDVKNIRDEMLESTAQTSRYRILRFSDEILHGVTHSREHFNQILMDIDAYEMFCNRHPDFENNVAEQAMAIIKKMYDYNSSMNSFLN